MRPNELRRFASWSLVGVLALASAGCIDASPSGVVDGGPGIQPVVVAEFEILDFESTNPDPSSDGTCQTGATLQFRSFRKAADGSISEQSYDPQGQPITFSWKDEIDFGDGTGRHPSFDWGTSPGDNVFFTDRFEVTKSLYTIAIHYVTLTVRTRDGRSATHEFRLTVTACEQCGTP